MKKTIKILLIAFSLLVILTNAFPILSAFNVYKYSNRSGTFSEFEYPMKGDNFDGRNIAWEQFKDTTRSTDTVLFRTFKKSPFHFWQWGEYLFNKRYKFPYLDPASIPNNKYLIQ